MKDEERDMWSQLLVDIKRAKAINTLCAEKSNHIKTTENEMAPGRSSSSVCISTPLPKRGSFSIIDFTVYRVPCP